LPINPNIVGSTLLPEDTVGIVTPSITYMHSMCYA